MTSVDSGMSSSALARELSRPGMEARSKRGAARELLTELSRAILRWPMGVWGAVDVLVCFSAFVAGHYLSPRFDWGLHQRYNVGVGATLFAGLVVCCNYAMGLYDRQTLVSFTRILQSAIVGIGAALAITSLLTAWVSFASIGRYVLINAFLLSLGGTIVYRLLTQELGRRARIRLMFVGQRRKFRMLECEIRRLYRKFYERPVYVTVPSGTAEERARALQQAFRRHAPDEVVVDDDEALMLELMRQSTEILETGCDIRAHSAYFEDLLRQIPVETIDHRGVLGGGITLARHGRQLIKRVFDISLSLVGLTIGLPMMALCVIIVRITSPGPVIYRQTRVGRYGRPFEILKFRSMRVDAERNGAVWAKKGDCRATWIGRIMRKTRLDELPQLWNILRGDMSFVGPRPERPEFVWQLRDCIPHYDLRHLVAPGLTGWAQVKYRYGASTDDARRKLAFDLYYLRHYGVMFDVAICLRTLVAMAKGAR